MKLFGEVAARALNRRQSPSLGTQSGSALLCAQVQPIILPSGCPTVNTGVTKDFVPCKPAVKSSSTEVLYFYSLLLGLFRYNVQSLVK